jgi:hypothetical protein
VRTTLIGDAITLSGSAVGGDDALVSRAGDDLMYGDAVKFRGAAQGGNDVFVFGPASGSDTIFDFRPGEDSMDVRPLGLSGITDLAITLDGGDSVVAFDGTGANAVRVVGVGSLVDADFLFV